MSTNEKGEDMQPIRTRLPFGNTCAVAAAPTAGSRARMCRAVAFALAGIMLAIVAAMGAFAQQAYAVADDAAMQLLGESYYTQDAASGTVYVIRGDSGLYEVSLDVGDRQVDGDVTAVSSNPAVATVAVRSPWWYSTSASLVITACAVGTTTISYQAPCDDGTVVSGTLNVRVFDIDLGKRSFTGFNYVLCPGLTATPKVSGLPKGTWKSSNTAVAKVSARGKISYKGLGACEVRGTFGPVDVVIPVDCTYKKAYKAVKNGFADANANITYSQAKRMNKGYRDCSSFVSRCFWDTSLKRKVFALGGTSAKSWALPAADQAKWLNGQKKCVAKKGVPASRLLAGDTVYTQTNYAGVNKRYRNIDHATLYVGAGMVLSTGGGKKHDIYLRNYPEDPTGTYVKFIGRPCAEPALNVTRATLTKKKGANHTIQLKMQWAKGKVKWSSSNKKVAKVNSKGKVTAKKKGTAKISAKVGGKTYKCKITVK